MFRTVPVSIIRSFLRACEQAVRKPVWHMPLLCVQLKTPDDEQRNCLKHVEFYCKNEFEKLEHLVGFIIRIFQNAQSSERQNHHQYQCFTQDVWLLSPLPISHSHVHTHSFDRREFKEGIRRLSKLISTEWDDIFFLISYFWLHCHDFRLVLLGNLISHSNTEDGGGRFLRNLFISLPACSPL